ncbi:excalibur calcium-binding domain-containing protein [Shewanella sp. BF02_Schw]|uniref:excalibur calcium-binding domain-containing protein n=1 Tax=Shewanella sp. BF02_Schw TaxID=394908 RepID=UPI0017836F03|nr:excalibur calcium-binding domain-containing protein [Shewanella sp. BF02_Schw]MBO1897351.1 excalibur calcium-binding domain-containing protein [Shewanella sp. BF02_Schw]
MERGILIRWNNEKGFGFIKPETGNTQDVFIHISTLKHMARKPIVGDEILFHRENQPDGKVKAVKASIEGVAVVSNTIRPASHTGQHHRNNPSHQDENYRSSPVLGRVIMLIILLGVGIFGYKQYQKMTATPVLTNENVEQMEWTPTVSKPSSINLQPQFRCEAGKTHCSQMRSCAEATFYTRNCPGTEMDGDGDGVPCERQFCN